MSVDTGESVSSPARLGVGELTEDRACVSCGYNLRGLRSDGRCPECAAPIARSLHGDLLSASDPAWLARVVLGQKMISLGCLAMLFGLIPIAVLVSLLGAVLPRGGLIRASLEVLPGLLLLGSVLLVLLGIFRLTTPAPRSTLTEEPIALRRVVRWIALGVVGLAALSQLGTAFQMVFGLPAGAATVCRLGFTWGAILGVVALVVGACFYLARLARRIPDLELAARTRWRATGFAGWAVLTLVVAALVGAFSVLTGGSGLLVLVVVAVILGLPAFWNGACLMYLMFAYRKAFKKGLAVAEGRSVESSRANTARST
jgi:hypothetical protein